MPCSSPLCGAVDGRVSAHITLNCECLLPRAFTSPRRVTPNTAAPCSSSATLMRPCYTYSLPLALSSTRRVMPNTAVPHRGTVDGRVSVHVTLTRGGGSHQTQLRREARRSAAPLMDANASMLRTYSQIIRPRRSSFGSDVNPKTKYRF